MKIVSKTNLWKWGAGLGLAVLGYVAWRQFLVKPHLAKQTFNNAAFNQYVEQAIAFHNAMNPSGNKLMRHFDGTDEEKLFRLAAQVKDFNAVTDAYFDMYNSYLSDDIASELNAKDLAKFNRIMKAKKK